VDRAVAAWEGSAMVRGRIEDLERATASVALFLEYIPENLHTWLADRIAEGGQGAESACAMVEAELKAGTSFMNSRGLLHFDAHFENILTDGHHLYFADFGMAISSRFHLAPDESEFFRRHAAYDRCYTVTHLVRWLTFELGPGGQGQRDALVRECAEGRVPDGVPVAAAAIIARYRPIAEIMIGFYRRLQDETRTAPYPAEEIERVCAQLQLLAP
jgi:serine/threonine protein kinase